MDMEDVDLHHNSFRNVHPFDGHGRHDVTTDCWHRSVHTHRLSDKQREVLEVAQVLPITQR